MLNGVNYLACFIVICILCAIGYLYCVRSDDFNLKCIVADVDGNKYCVRERKNMEKAANLLAAVTNKLKQLVAHMKETEPDSAITTMLKQNFNPDKIRETLPTSSYTAYSENKGEKIAFCLNTHGKGEEHNDHLIDESVLTFVAIHELAHTCTASVGHEDEFWETFQYLLKKAKEAGIYTPVDYKKNPQKYCGTTVADNPYFDLKK